jgi:hypothetical protein
MPVLRILDDAVERDEQPGGDLAHGVLLVEFGWCSTGQDGGDRRKSSAYIFRPIIVRLIT